MSARSHTRLVLALVGLAAAAAIVLSVASGAETKGTRAAAGAHPLLGVTGNASRFMGQTGQDSTVVQAFLGWGHGQTYGSPFAQLFPTLGLIPMIHLGTGSGIAGGQARREIITPMDIAEGKGDSYLIALNHAIANWGKAIYVRPMAEMNLYSTFYSGYNANGTLKDAAHDPARYREAFSRIYVILHGGTVEQVNAKLARLKLPPVDAEELLPNAFPRLRIIWSPLASANPRNAGNAASNYYPGNSYVDIIGGDIYDEAMTDTAPWAGLEGLFASAKSHGKPFAIPEAGLNAIDDPAFVNHVCNFLKAHPSTEVYVHYESKPGSPYDFSSKPKSELAYRQCIVPLAGALPDWAAANAPGGGANVTSLTLTPRPAAGAPPHTVTFAISAKLTVPIQQWLLVFDDGTETGGTGAPPATVRHTYAAAGVYPATLIVWPFPPFTSAAARFYTSADVTVGTDPPAVLSIVPTPDSGGAPLAVSFRIEEAISGPITSWQLIFGDGKTREGTGAPPHFAGHTFVDDGTYDVLLVVNQSSGRRYLALSTVVAGSGGTGGGGGGTGGGGAQQPPPTGTKTGTVLVNGQPFTGGTIPFNAVVDVTNGTLTLTTPAGKMKFYGQNKILARFKMIRGTDTGKPIIELKLVGGNFSVCPKPKKNKPTRKPSSASATKPTKPVRQLWGDGKGKFRTKGRYASATVRGTNWLSADRCDGTFIRVKKGVIEVRDIPDRRTVRIRAPRTYLATP